LTFSKKLQYKTSVRNYKNGIFITTVVVVDAPHGPVLMVRHGDLSDLDKGIIQPMTILSCHETNLATI
jgi:hypothetical protein